MARPGFMQHRKFQRLARALEPHSTGVGGEIAAAGALELLWHVAYEAGDAFLGESLDVEAAARWRGEAGALTKALLEAGGRGAAGFIEKAPGRPGRYRVHDLFDHAPEYVRKRLLRETERRQKGTDLAAERAAAGRKGAEARWQAAGKRQSVAMDAAEDGKRLANGTPPAPSPHPLPHPPPPPAQETSSPSPAAPARPRGKAGEKVPDPRHRPLQQLLEAAYLELVGTAYGFEKRDASAIAKLIALSQGNVDEVDRRWRRALTLGSKWPGCATIALLPGRWNERELVAASPPSPRGALPAATAEDFENEPSGGFGT